MKVVGSDLSIWLETGPTIEMPKIHGIRVGDKVLVAYDHTKGEYRQVMRHVEDARFKEIEVEEPIKQDHVGEDDDSDILVLDSGALRTEGEGFWEFWDSDSGVLELSEPCSDGF